MRKQTNILHECGHKILRIQKYSNSITFNGYAIIPFNLYLAQKLYLKYKYELYLNTAN